MHGYIARFQIKIFQIIESISKQFLKILNVKKSDFRYINNVYFAAIAERKSDCVETPSSKM